MALCQNRAQGRQYRHSRSHPVADKVWPQCIQVQGKHDHQGDLILMVGAESKEHRGKDANTPIPISGGSAEKPGRRMEPGGNHLSERQSRFLHQQQVLNQTKPNAPSTPGFIGIQSEGSEFEIRFDCYCPLKY